MATADLMTTALVTAHSAAIPEAVAAPVLIELAPRPNAFEAPRRRAQWLLSASSAELQSVGLAQPETALTEAPVPEPAVTETAPPAPDAAPAATSSETDSADPDFEDVPKADDPFEGFNRISFGFSMAVDKALIRPAAIAYRTVVPKPGRDGARNFLQNVGEPMVALNDLLQLRPKRMFRTIGRFLLNTTLGIGGLFDVAKRKPFRIDHHNNSFGSTLGYYGVKPGPYIYIPILGPTTLRDQINRAPDPIRLPERVRGRDADLDTYNVTTTIVDGLGQRERSDDELKAMMEDAIDRYATFRENFLQNRQGEIAELRGK